MGVNGCLADDGYAFICVHRKKKKRKLLDKDAVEAEWKTVSKQSSEGQQVAKKTKPEDHKTEAEKKYDKVQKERVSAVRTNCRCELA